MPRGIYKHSPLSEKTKEKIRENNAHYWKGKKRSVSARNKMKKSAMNPERIKVALANLPKHPKGYNSGAENPRWKGGISQRFRMKNYEKVAGRVKPAHCELCGLERKICFDHNHKTGDFRGWICFNCNVVLGLANDDTQLLQKMIIYLDKNK